MWCHKSYYNLIININNKSFQNNIIIRNSVLNLHKALPHILLLLKFFSFYSRYYTLERIVFR